MLVLTIALLFSACNSSVDSNSTIKKTTSTAVSTPQQTVTGAISPTPQLTQQYRFTEQDSGKTVTYVTTSRMSLIFNTQKNPLADLKLSCHPTEVLGWISNTPSVEPPLYAVSYQAVQPGICTFKNGSFLLTVKVIENYN